MEFRDRPARVLDKHGLRMPYPTPFSERNTAWLKKQSLGFMDDAILRSDLTLLEAVDEQFGFVEERIAAIAVEDPQARLLMTMTGVEYFTVMLLLAEVGDVRKFHCDKKFASWMGLAPRVHQSGERTRIGGISGPGNKRLRWAMMECTHAAIRYDARFRSLYERYSRRKGKEMAVVTVAHEMARIVYFMLKRDEPYRGENRGLTERKLKSMSMKTLNGLRN